MHDENTSPVANALRKAGYVPLPRLWIKAEDMPKIHKIAHQHLPGVRDIRKAFNDDQSAYKDQPAPDPISDREAAWAAYEKMRGG
jgi:hypothetical protein